MFILKDNGLDIFQIYRNIHAYTIAEVIIVLGIIGIIAEITIPSLIINTQTAQLKAGIKVAYSIISQAVEIITLNNGGTFTNLWIDTYDNVSLKNIMINQLNITKDCGGATGTNSTNSPVTNGCWITTTALDNSTDTEFNNYAGVILSNGMYAIFRAHLPNCSTVMNDPTCGWIMIDVNGPKSPNKIGKDSFFFYINSDGSVGIGGDSKSKTIISGDPNPGTCTGTETGIRSGWGCTYRYLYEE